MLCMYFNPTAKCNTTNEEDENLDEHSINNEHQQDEEILKINEKPIPEVSSTKFLGVTIDNRLSWIPHINDLNTRSLSQQQVCLKLNVCVIISPKKIINHYTMLFLTYCITVFGTVSKTCTVQVKSYLKSKDTA